VVVPLPVDGSAEAVEDQEEGSVDDQQNDPEDVVHVCQLQNAIRCLINGSRWVPVERNRRAEIHRSEG